MPPPQNSDGLGTRLSRASSLARLSASTGAGFLTSRLRGDEQRFHLENAERMLELLGSMKGAAMKLGQLASFVDLDLPPEIAELYREVLADLRDAAPPVDPAGIAAVVRDEFGAPPGEVFEAWEDEPMAAASIGQVHRARLPGGREVVVKVQYPGIAEAVEADLANAELFIPFARLISPNLKVRPLVEELRVRVIDELDYQREAQYQQAFFERYDGHPFIRVPQVHREYCRPRVLVSDYVDGLGFDGMLANTTDEQRQRYGEIIYRFVYGSLNRFRLFNADPHPGNYLFPADGTVVFIDFGSVKPFPSRVRDDIRDQLQALVADDIDQLRKTMDAAGFLPDSGEVDMDKLAEWFRIFNTPILQDAEWTYTSEWAREVIRTTSDPRLGYVDLLRRLNLPPDYLTLNRIQWGVNSILGRLQARRNWQRIQREFWEDAPPATELGRLERPFVDASPFRS